MSSMTHTTPIQPRQRWARTLLAGPGAIVVTLVVCGHAAVAAGRLGGHRQSGISARLRAPDLGDAVLHACLDRRIARVALVGAVLFFVHGGMVAYRFVTAAPAAAPVLGEAR
ncbi:hypothetical protein U1737_09865 [Sphingomonas sp. LB3N6]|uniref:hypothetical protein n=1 Tax=Sphingomonas fucosidasi TaxID=3096164 RepID=UPI002FCC3677